MTLTESWKAGDLIQKGAERWGMGSALRLLVPSPLQRNSLIPLQSTLEMKVTLQQRMRVGIESDLHFFPHVSIVKETCPCPRPWHHGDRSSLIFEIIQPWQSGENQRPRRNSIRTGSNSKKSDVGPDADLHRHPCWLLELLAPTELFRDA